MAQWLSSFGVAAEAIAAARPAALVWALERGSRSGRVAYQFARDYAGSDSASRPLVLPAIAPYERPRADRAASSVPNDQAPDHST